MACTIRPVSGSISSMLAGLLTNRLLLFSFCCTSLVSNSFCRVMSLKLKYRPAISFPIRSGVE